MRSASREDACVLEPPAIGSQHRTLTLALPPTCESFALAGSDHAGGSLEPCPVGGVVGLARRARRSGAGGGAPQHRDRHEPLALAAGAELPRPRLSRRRRLHGPGQLGDLARRRVALRLHAPLRGAGLQPDGDRPAIALRAARGGERARPRAGLPRLLSGAGLLRALGAGGARHLRHRPCRSDRHGDRPQPAPRHPARDRRRRHRPRRVPGALSAEQGLSLDRGVHHHAARRHRGLLRRADRARAARILGGPRRLRARSADRDQPRHALSGARHPRRDRDAAQPLSPHGDRADARLWRHAAGEARGDPVCDDRIRPPRCSSP